MTAKTLNIAPLNAIFSRELGRFWPSWLYYFNRDANCFLPVESKDCINSASYELRNMSVRRGAQFVPIRIPTIFCKTFPTKTTKMLSTRNSNILMMSSSEYLFLESECSFTKYASSWPKTIYLYLRLPFLKWRSSEWY